MSVQRFISVLLFVALQLLQPSNALYRRATSVVLDTVVGTRGGGDGRREQFEELLRRAQVDPSEVLNNGAGSPLGAMSRVLSSPGPLPDLMTICNMAAVYKSGVFKDGMEAGKETYTAMKINFAKEFEEAMGMVDDEDAAMPGEQQRLGLDEAAKSAMMMERCIKYLTSDYLNACFFAVENFRQQVLKNPFWQGLVKASMITHLGDDCPDFEEILRDSDDWNYALMACQK